MSWFFEEHKIYCHIKVYHKDSGILYKKGFGILECNFNNLAKLTNEVKQIIHAEETDNSDYVMTCTNTIPSISNTLNKLLLHKIIYSSYIQTE